MAGWRLSRRLSPLRLTLAGLMAGLAVMGLSFHFSPHAQAAQCTDKGRACLYGYFTNQGPYNSGWFVFNNGIAARNLNDFIATFSGKLKCVNPGTAGATWGVSQTDYEATGAAFTLLTMLGAAPGTAKNQACVRWNEWTNLVTAYDQAGLVHYSEMHDFQCLSTMLIRQISDIVYIPECGAALSIVFYGKDGSALYAIKHECGNPGGVQKPLPPLTTTTPPTPPGTTPPGATPPGTTPPGTTPPGTTPPGTIPPGEPPVPPGTPPSTTPTVSVHCDSYDVFPSAIDPNTPFSLTVGVRYGSAAEVANVLAQADTSFYVRVTSQTNGGLVYDNANVRPINRNGLTLQVTVNNIQPTREAGTFIITWGIAGSYGPINCGGTGNVTNDGVTPEPPATFNVTYKPYYKVNAGDVSAGAGIDVGGLACGAPAGLGPNKGAGIVGWNRGNGGGYGATGNSYGAFALGHIQAFATGQGNAALAPSGLAFANTGGDTRQIDPGRQLYGGEMGSLPCTADYFKNASNILQGNQRLSTLVGLNPGDTYRVNNSDRKSIYVNNGSVLVDVNVQFSGNYANPREVPAFAMVVRGNIYIDANVHRMDGFYIAQPTNASVTNGIIYTCAPSGFGTMGANVLNSDLHSVCHTTLTVNGSFVARQVWLLRSEGTMSTDVAAETFNYNPSLWLSAPFGNGLSPTVNRDYDAITSLPPVL